MKFLDQLVGSSMGTGDSVKDTLRIMSLEQGDRAHLPISRDSKNRYPQRTQEHQSWRHGTFLDTAEESTSQQGFSKSSHSSSPFSIDQNSFFDNPITMMISNKTTITARPFDEPNLHDVEDYSRESVHEQLPSVEEVRIRRHIQARKSDPTYIPRRTITVGLAVASVVLLFFIVFPGRNKATSEDVASQIVSFALNGEADFEDEHSYQSFAKRWMTEDSAFYDHPLPKMQQRYAMFCLYHAVNGRNWYQSEGWRRKGVPECEWHGVTCDPETGMVKRIFLRDNNLAGKIPEEITLIKELGVLNINDNDNLEGSVPYSVCAIKDVRSFDIKVNCQAVDCACCSNC